MAWTTPRTWAAAATLTAAQLNTDIRDNFNALAPDAITKTSWTPTVAGSTSGASAAADQGAEYQIGPLQFAWAYWLDFNPSGQGGVAIGNLSVLLPAVSDGITAAAGGQVIGSWRILDSSATANSLSGAVYLSAAGTCRFGLPSGNVLQDTTITLATGDTFSMYVCYPVA
jgi:hypothetical protein